MPPPPDVSAADLDRLRHFDSCTLSNAIERFDVRLRNEGYMSGSVRCQFPALPPMIGYAVTGRIRTYAPPMTGGWYYENMELWRQLATAPAPRVLVMRDADGEVGRGAFVGAIHAHICRALDCVGYVTDGAVRDLPAVEATGFQLFAGSVAVSHSYAHLFELGAPVEVGGLTVSQGDLLFGDRHGVLSIPSALVAALPEAASRLLAEERELIKLCDSNRFSLDELAGRLAHPRRHGRRAAAPTPEDLA
jgi:4-hydroxy-4-methyl-2-oxoglutarate aldolase